MSSQIENFLPWLFSARSNLRILAKKKPIFQLYKVILTFSVLFTPFVEATITRVVDSNLDDASSDRTLPYWLLNASEGDIIDCSLIAGQSIILTSSLPAITNSYTINGAGITIDGNSNYQAFQVASGTVTINNVIVQNAISKGGKGGDGYSGGGGAVGGGGALYIHGDTSVTLTASSLLNNIARGGDGGAADNIGNGGGGGGGGFGGGNGGSCVSPMPAVSTGGGGGGHSNGGNGGGTELSIDGGNGIYFGGGGGGGGLNSVALAGIGGNASPNGAFTGGSTSIGNGNGGGGAGDSEDGLPASEEGGSKFPGNGGNGIGADFLFGGGGGGGTSSESTRAGGNGVGAAGGGGGFQYSGGTGGILGGGGGGCAILAGGEGGFGSGGGGAASGGSGGGSFGAGGGNGGSNSSGNAGGGGGSGLGGAIFIQSSGSLIIEDAAQISDNTAIFGVGGSSTGAADPGYIPAGDGLAMGYDIFVRETGSITFNLNNTLVISTPIEGDQTNGPDTSGGLYKLGKGTLKLNGANTYSGVTNVDAGELNLNGSVIGNATIYAEGCLSGNATVSGDLTSSGVLAPGNSIGTINTTNLFLTPSSLLEIEVASTGASDLITANGSAQINGTLKIIPLTENFQTAQAYTFITATDGITGTFSKIESSGLSLLQVSYNPNGIIVDVLPISALELSPNALSAASCYLSDGFIPGSDVETVSAALLTLDGNGINNGFNQMQPSQFSGLAWSQLQNTLLIRSSYSQHLEKVNLASSSCNGHHVWGEVIGDWQKQNPSGEQFGYTDWGAGATVGVDAVCQGQFRFGLAGSYIYSHLNWSESAGHANTNSYYGGVYMNWLNQRGYINATLIGAYTHYQTNRHVHFSTINRHAKSSYHSWEGLAGIEGGLNFACTEHMEIVPFIRADYVYLSRQEFTEKGAQSLNLSVKGKQDQIIQSEIGVSLIAQYAYESSSTSGTFVPRIKVSYINDAQLSSRNLSASFINSDCNFTVQGISFPKNLGTVSLGLTHLNSAGTISITLRYDGQFGHNYYNQGVNGAFDIKF